MQISNSVVGEVIVAYIAQYTALVDEHAKFPLRVFAVASCWFGFRYIMLILLRVQLIC